MTRMQHATMPDGPGRSVLFVGAYPPMQAGTRAISEELALRLSARGWTVTCTSHRSGRAARVVDVLATSWQQGATVDVAHIDVFSGAALRWAEGAAAILSRRGCPFVLTLHGGNLPAEFERAPARMARLLGRAAAVTAPSPYLQRVATAVRPDTQVIPNGLDLSAYRQRTRAIPGPSLLWLRAFHAMYAPVLAIDVAARLVERFPTLRLRMVGPDKDGSRHAVDAHIASQGLQAHVTTSGAVPKTAVPEVLDAADIFLNTTTVDNSPVSVLEAMAAGLCVISTDVGGLRDLVRDGHDALLVPVGDAEAMAAAVGRVLTEPGLARRLSDNARRRAAACDWSAVVLRWEALLHQLATPELVTARG